MQRQQAEFLEIYLSTVPYLFTRVLLSTIAFSKPSFLELVL